MKGRIRTIKPDTFKDEALWDLAQETGLPALQAFAGLWCFADKEGRFEWRPRALKADILPYWDGDFSRVLDALSTRGFVVRYSVAGRDYGLVRTFKRHQVINNRESDSELPAPPDEDTAPSVIPGTSTREARVLDAPPSGESRDSGALKRKGMGREWEGNGNGNVLAPLDAQARDVSESVPQARPLAAAPFATSSALEARERLVAAAASLVRREFAPRFEAVEPGQWNRAGDPAVELVARWLLSLRTGELAANLARLLDGFFADKWVIANHCPIQHLAKHPEKYFEPRAAPVQAAKVDHGERLAELSAELETCKGELQHARIRANDELPGAVEAVAELVDRMDEIRAEMRKLKGGT